MMEDSKISQLTSRRIAYDCNEHRIALYIFLYGLPEKFQNIVGSIGE